MTAIFHYSMQLSMNVFAPHIGAELDWLQLTFIIAIDQILDGNVHAHAYYSNTIVVKGGGRHTVANWKKGKLLVIVVT